MDNSENFHQQLRDLAPLISDARINVMKKESELKKEFWVQICKAKDDGERSYNHQKSKAEATNEYYNATMAVAIAKANLDQLQLERAATEMQFEEWRTKMANLRSERQRYGA